MRHIIATIVLASTISHAEIIDLGTNAVALPQASVTAIDVGSIQYNSDDNSWMIHAQPVVSYQQPRDVGGVNAAVHIVVSLSITVTRAEIEATLGQNVDDTTVKALNDTVRQIALGKALAALTVE